MKLVYIAGPYSGTPIETEQNILNARKVALKVAKQGLFPVCPHLNTYGFEHLDTSIHSSFYYDGTLELMRRCDAVVMVVDGYESSKGSLNELRTAIDMGLTVYSEDEIEEMKGE